MSARVFCPGSNSLESVFDVFVEQQAIPLMARIDDSGLGIVIGVPQPCLQ